MTENYSHNRHLQLKRDYATAQSEALKAMTIAASAMARQQVAANALIIAMSEELEKREEK